MEITFIKEINFSPIVSGLMWFYHYQVSVSPCLNKLKLENAQYFIFAYCYAGNIFADKRQLTLNVLNNDVENYDCLKSRDAIHKISPIIYSLY